MGRAAERGAAEVCTARIRSLHRVLLVFCFLAALALRLWYGSAWPGSGRFWDERYALENVRSILLERTLLPVKSYYPSPVFNLPPAIAIAATGAWMEDPSDGLFDRSTGRFGPRAYRLCRGLQAVAGALAVLALYALGRAVFGRSEGLLAAALLAFVPWHVHASGIFKPDALLSLGVVAALAAATWFFARPAWSRAVALGAAVALAASAKLTGALVAVPVGVAALWLWRRRPRRWIRLAVAGGASVLLFIVVNPYWWAYLRFVGGLQRDYEMRAEWEGMSRWGVPRRFLEMLLQPTVFGWVMGGAAVAAFGWLLLRVARRGGVRSSEQRAGLLAVTLFPPLYVLVYSLQTPYFKPNNFLPLIPLFALALAAATVELGRRAGGRPAAALLASVVLAPAVWLGWAYVYRSLVPSTCDAAVDAASPGGEPAGRVVLAWEASCGTPAWEPSVRRGRRAAVVEVAGARERPNRWNRADGEVFRIDWEAGAAALRHHQERWPEQLATFRARPFAMRGPPMVGVRHAWRRVGAQKLSLRPCGPLWRCGKTVPQQSKSWSSVSLWLPARGYPGDAPRLRVGDREVTFHQIYWRRGGLLWTTERYRRPREAEAIRLHVEGPMAKRARLRLLDWRRPKLGR